MKNAILVISALMLIGGSISGYLINETKHRVSEAKRESDNDAGRLLGKQAALDKRYENLTTLDHVAGIFAGIGFWLLVVNGLLQLRTVWARRRRTRLVL